MPESSFTRALNAIPIQPRLKDHRVWPVSLAKAEAGAEIIDEVGFLLDGCNQRLIDFLLVLDTVFGGFLLLCTCEPKHCISQ